MDRLLLIIIRNLIIIPQEYLKLRKYANRSNNYTEEERYGYFRTIFQKAIQTGNIDLKVYGQENIPKENGFMLYSNHQGKFDLPAIVSTCDNPIGVVFKKELYRNHFVKLLADSTFSFPIDRKNAKQSMSVIRRVIEEVKKGRSYLIFPEGETSKSNKMTDFHTGSFRCAIKTHCPIVPVVLVDSFKPFDEKGCGKTQVQIHYLPPIYYNEYKDMTSADLASFVRERIKQTIETFYD
ncbi:MAG: 1-acyl-sn-glycerol-3-phosphate acyltransferase [Oscillospiraceae bacterium]|nr:1-acyl-sn-glycerol-3-phosphate acyltransferase [Oscillospiraceae bacterium]